MTSPHDHLFQQAFAQLPHARALLQHALPAALARAIGWHSLADGATTLVDARLRRREADLLFTAGRAPGHSDADRRPILLLLEHKSEPAPYAALQLLGYAVRIWEHHRRARTPLPDIVPIVVHHGPRPWTAATSLAHLLAPRLCTARHRVDFPFYLLDLARHSEAELRSWHLPPLAKLALLLLQFVRQLAPDALLAALRRWGSLFAAAVATPGDLDQIEVFHSYLLQASDLEAGALADCMGDILGPTGHHHVMSTADKLIAKGKAQGRDEGRNEGRIEQLLLLLHRRFGDAAASATAQIRKGSLADLDRWALRVLDARTLADVFADA